MPLPKVAVFHVLRPVVGLGAVDVSQDLVVDVADDDGASEGRVGRPLEHIGQGARRLLAALVEGRFRGGEIRVDL